MRSTRPRAPGTSDPSTAAESGSSRDLRSLAMQRRMTQRRGSGAPLDENTRERMGGALGADLSQVRVHTGEEAHAAAGELKARAFTTGNDVYFKEGAYAPGSQEGDRLLAHELAHTVQGEKSGVQCKSEVSQAGDAAEQEADQAADATVSRLHGGDAAAPKLTAHAVGFSRKEDDAPDAKKADEKKADGDEKGEEKKADAAPFPYPPGTTGIVSVDIDSVPAGTPVKVIDGDEKILHCETLDGTQKLDAPFEQFKYEPGVTTNETTQKPRDDVYQDYAGSLWGADGPKAEDVQQGELGDCYLAASMMALAARDPGAIKAIFNPQEANAPYYTVKLWFPDADGKPVAYEMPVDTELPTKKGTDHQAAYAGYDKHVGAEGAPPLWPSLIEKAYAALIGGYDVEARAAAPPTP